MSTQQPSPRNALCVESSESWHAGPPRGATVSAAGLQGPRTHRAYSYSQALDPRRRLRRALWLKEVPECQRDPRRCPPSCQGIRLLASGGRRPPAFKRMVCCSRQVLLTTDLLVFPARAHIPVSLPHTSSYSNHSWSLTCVPETVLTFAKELGGRRKNKKIPFISH